jgi:5-formyltetrahydrofolate cyclo-ligase
MTRQESDNMQSSVRVLKIALRKQMRQQLRAVTQETILLETERVAEKLFQLPEYKNSHKVSIYLNMGGEIRTDGIIKHLLNNGKRTMIYSIDGHSYCLHRQTMFYTALPWRCDGNGASAFAGRLSIAAAE